MKKFRKAISGLMALSLMFASVPQVINAYDVQTNTSPKLVCSESSYADAQEITDEYIINTFLADWFKDDYCDNGFVYLNGREHKVYAHDQYYNYSTHKERSPEIFYITYDHESEICIARKEGTNWNEVDALVEEFIKEQNLEGVYVSGRIRGTLVLGYDGVDEKLADKLGDYLEEKGVMESITYTPSYSDAASFVIPTRYPYEYASVINSLISELGLSRSDIYVDVSNGDCRLEYADGRVTQKQRLELAAEIYRKTGVIGDYDFEEYQGDISSVWIDDKFTDQEDYVTASGMRVRNQGYSRFHTDAKKITDDKITAFYSELLKKVNPNFASSPDFGEFREFYAYDTVYFDNSKYNGEWLNRGLLGHQILCMQDFPSYLTININTNDTDALAAALEEKFGLSSRNIRIHSSYSNHMDIRGSYTDMTEELADSIYSELKNMGYSVDATFSTCGLSDGMIEGSIGLPAEYPVSKQDEIMAIVNASGVNAKVKPCQHYSDESDYFDLIFDDVYNTTQMDIVKLRTEIFEKTGECGLVNAGEFKPEYKGCLQFGVTDATTTPDRTTYVDVKLGQNTGFCTFITQINYDHDNLELVSASLKNNPENDVDFLVSDNKSRMLLMDKKSENIYMSNEDVIRLAFRVKKDAPDGKYEISLSVPEGQGSGVCCINNSDVEWVKSEFTPGYITVDSNSVPVTQTKPMPLSRMYAVVKDGDTVVKPELTGDVNNDGRFNVMDVLRMKRYFVGTEETISNADTNEDGVVNIADLLVLSNNIIGIQ